MAYPISLVHGAPRFQTLPVLKITDYPLEQREYRPFVQARLCANEDTFFVRMWAFEAEVLPESRLTAQFDFAADGQRYIELWMDSAGGHGAALRDGQGAMLRPLEDVRFADFCGEDLQGIYWGGTAELPRGMLEALFPMTKLQKGVILKGNLLKLCENEARVHFGCLFPAGGPADAAGTARFGAFELVGY